MNASEVHQITANSLSNGLNASFIAVPHAESVSRKCIHISNVNAAGSRTSIRLYAVYIYHYDINI